MCRRPKPNNEDNSLSLSEQCSFQASGIQEKTAPNEPLRLTAIYIEWGKGDTEELPAIVDSPTEYKVLSSLAVSAEIGKPCLGRMETAEALLEFEVELVWLENRIEAKWIRIHHAGPAPYEKSFGVAKTEITNQPLAVDYHKVCRQGWYSVTKKNYAIILTLTKSDLL
jgi:hypothetical protein